MFIPEKPAPGLTHFDSLPGATSWVDYRGPILGLWPAAKTATLLIPGQIDTPDIAE